MLKVLQISENKLLTKNRLFSKSKNTIVFSKTLSLVDWRNIAKTELQKFSTQTFRDKLLAKVKEDNESAINS